MKTISLFSGAGGMDLGFKNAGFEILWANDIDKNSCLTYKANIGDHIYQGDVVDKLDKIAEFKNIDLVIGGPPCQGFSVAGKMDPFDPRSEHIWNFVNIIQLVMPRAFVMENVKALGSLKKWELVRNKLLDKFRELGYSTNFIILNASDFNVPQARERVFFIGFKNNPDLIPDLKEMIEPYKKPGPTVREALKVLDKAGEGNNLNICNAKITITPYPVVRKSPYAGMLFNGLGRPLKIDGYCSTLPASMGGNKTPIIDEDELYKNKKSWVESYHNKLIKGSDPLPFQEAPKRLRRITTKEASILQSFPYEYIYVGSQSSIYRQIGNSVPPNLAYSIGKMMFSYLMHDIIHEHLIPIQNQLKINFG
jgi:DNA (cytosine-5)-methyltransferase 1